MQDYVHRIGRTGRAGSTGHSVTCVSLEDREIAAKLVPILEEAKCVQVFRPCVLVGIRALDVL